MIFVTVGTHEQQFDRLIREMDVLREDGVLENEVIAQIGFSTYEPQKCKWSRFFPYEKMNEYIQKAEIVITHGGPASFIAPLQIGKIPIVVPRQKRFGEHVNDHQLEFCRRVKDRWGNIILVEDIGNLLKSIADYEGLNGETSTGVRNNNSVFVSGFERLISDIFAFKV